VTFFAEKLYQKTVSVLNWDGSGAGFFGRMEWVTPLILLIFSVWGVAAIFSAGSMEDDSFWKNSFAQRQLIFIGLGWVVYLVVSLVDYKFYGRFAGWLYLIGIFFLTPVALCALFDYDLSPFIVARNGARRWIAIGSYTFQPSELAKITTLLLLSWTIGRGVILENIRGLERILTQIFLAFLPKKISGQVPLFAPLIVRITLLTMLPFLLTFIQPDLTSSLIFIPMAFALLFIANTPLRFFAVLGLLALPLIALLTIDMVQYGNALKEYTISQKDNLKARDPAHGIRDTYTGGVLPIRNYQRERIMALINRDLIDPDGTVSSWQSTQGKMALARGGVTGQGFQNGMLVRLGYLPEAAAHNDFIFSCIGEESGFIGGCSIITIFGLLIGMTMKVAAKARDKFGTCIAIGAGVITALHVVTNIGMNIGILPVTGVSLPLLSYGGSFTLSCFLLFGLVQSVYRSSHPLQIKNTDTSESLAPAQLSERIPV